MYLIMKAYAEFNGDKLGVLRLDNAQAQALDDMVCFATHLPTFSGRAALESVTFIGPELCGITNDDEGLNLPPVLSAALDKEGLLVVDLPDDVLDKLQPIDTERIVIDKDGEVHWRCETNEDKYEVSAPRTINWTGILAFVSVDQPDAVSEGGN
ncbi:MAG: hypothetical protein RBT34_00300 [Anaerolineaceae bacterium]|jgi:hypothetical protein|nr:hypothetical protein [Anaerolineaceae bacterium]